MLQLINLLVPEFKMKKYLSISLVLASSLFLSACSLKTPNQTSNSDNNSAKSTFSLRDLIAQNIPQKCNYSGSDDQGSFDTEILISGKKFKQTIKYKSVEGEETINSISDGEYVYTWGNHFGGNAFATKMKADFENKNTPDIDDSENYSSSEDSGSSVDLDSDFQGKCSPTVVSDSDFQVPTDIKFQDYSQMIEDWQKSLPNISEDEE